MIDRKLLVEALRVDNKDVLPKFGSSELKKMLEAATEYLSINDLIDMEDRKITEDGIRTLMDLLERGSAGVADQEGQPFLNFIKNGPEILAHNMLTDEDDVLDASAEALNEYIIDAFSEDGLFESVSKEVTNVIFKKELDFNEEEHVIAVFPDIIEQPGDEGRIAIYDHDGHSYVPQWYLETLEDATPEEYEPLKEELEGQGYVLNILNGSQEDESVNEELQNYGVCVAQDKGNDIEILGIKSGYHSFEEAQSVINDMETDFEFQDDPTLMLFVVYSDGVSWFNAVTGDEVDYPCELELKPEALNKFKSVKDAKVAISHAKRFLQKELDKGNFKENFGREKVRELKNQVPTSADAMDQDDLRKIQDLVSAFDEWCATVTPKQKAMKSEYSEIDAMVEDVYNRIQGTAATVKNMLISAYRNNEEKGMKDLDRIYSLVEDAMEQLMTDIESYTKDDTDYDEED